MLNLGDRLILCGVYHILFFSRKMILNRIMLHAININISSIIFYFFVSLKFLISKTFQQRIKVMPGTWHYTSIGTLS